MSEFVFKIEAKKKVKQIWQNVDNYWTNDYIGVNCLFLLLLYIRSKQRVENTQHHEKTEGGIILA